MVFGSRSSGCAGSIVPPSTDRAAPVERVSAVRSARPLSAPASSGVLLVELGKVLDVLGPAEQLLGVDQVPEGPNPDLHIAAADARRPGNQGRVAGLKTFGCSTTSIGPSWVSRPTAVESPRKCRGLQAAVDLHPFEDPLHPPAGA